MTRRILLAFVGITLAVLAGAVVPLGIEATMHERSDYLEDATTRAQLIAATAEESLVDHQPDGIPRALFTAARHDGDGLIVTDPNGKVLASDASTTPVPASLIAQVRSEETAVTRGSGGALLVAAPIRQDGPGGDTGPLLGVAVLVHPTGQLRGRIETFWLTLTVLAVAALAVAVAVGVTLARWVARPLAALDTSARRLGDGDLAVRAPVTAGPPELRRLATTFNTMAARLETLVHGHRAVVADVSHQLRTPLAALRLRLDLLAADSNTPPADLIGAQDEVARLSRLVDGLLAVARAENTTPHPVAVDVDDVIADRVDAWRPVATERDIHIEAVTPQPITALLGEGHLEQILDNLIANAIDAINGQDATDPTAGTDHRTHHVVVSATRTGDRVHVTVADDGPGMPETERTRAFHRFASGGAGGTGLGLAIVHRLVTATGGTVELTETDGGGLTVVLDLPAATPDTPLTSRDQPRTEDMSRTGRRRRIGRVT